MTRRVAWRPDQKKVRVPYDSHASGTRPVSELCGRRQPAMNSTSTYLEHKANGAWNDLSAIYSHRDAR